ncbi:MAG: RidA family protein [Bacteroidetes bacterium]|nr:MAG: RidA family protein [Bacteroidota bacterium]
MKTIFTKNAPAPGGHYAQAIAHHHTIYISGQLPIDPNGKKLTHATVEDQTRCVLNNIQSILKAAGSDLNRILQMTIYIADLEDWGKINAVYADFFGEHKPARAIVPVTGLHYGSKLEIQAIAALWD